MINTVKNMPHGTAVQMTGRELREAATAAGYAVGSAIAQRRGVMDVQLPLARVLPPLAEGYAETRKTLVS